MGLIGAPEIIVALLGLALVAVVVAIVVRLVKRVAPSAGLVPCRSCHRRVSPRATSCPKCGEPLTV